MRNPERDRRSRGLRTLVTTAALIVTAVGVVLLSPATAALAGDPVSLDGRYVVDESGVLGGDESAVQDAIDTLATEQGVNLFVVYTDSFTNPADRQAWASEVATINQFGRNDVLLAVATEDRVYQLSVDQDFALSDDQLAAIETDDIVPALRDGDWGGAAVAAAEGLDAQLGGSGGSGSGSSSTGGGGIGGLVWVVAILIIVVVAALVAVLIIRRRRSIDSAVTAQAEVAGPTQKELDQQVGAVLVDLDDAVTSSDQELGFATAQFGTEATQSFTAVLADVKRSLSEAFALKQKLDDAVPDTAEERRAWSEQIIAICDAASDKLDAEVDAFDALRAVEKDPTPALTTATRELEALKGRGTEARERVGRLTANYDAGALTTAMGSVEQADALRTFAENEIQTAATALTSGNTAEAALSIRDARQAVAQSDTLYTSIATLESDLAQAAQGLGTAIAEARQDLAEVAALDAARPTPDPAFVPLTAALGTELARAESMGARDPLNARIAVEKANGPLDAALASVRDEQQRVARLVAQRDRAISTAQSEIGAATSYLQTRRGAVGPDARTRLSEAQRHLDQALTLATSDPEASLREATSASQLAALATSSAQQDVSWAQGSGSSSAGGYGGGSGGGSGGGDFSGALLGGILGGLLGGGGGGRSSSWGGSSGGWSGGWGGGSRGSRGGGFGGGSRRSSGGSFGGGGRRGGGGRF